MAESSLPRRLLELGALFSVLALFLALYAPTVDEILRTRDHGVHLARAVQLELGRHPFVDYPGGVYGPLVFYASYLAQVVFGWCLRGEVVLDMLGFAVGYLCLYAVFRRVSGSRSIALVAFVSGVLLLPRFYKYYIVLGPALFLFALEAACRRGLKATTLLGMACATCVTGLFRLDYGAHALAASLLVIALSGPTEGWRASLRHLGKYAAFGLLCSAPVLVPFVLSTNPFDALGETVALVRAAKGGLAKGFDHTLPVPGLAYAKTRFMWAFWGFRILPWASIVACLVFWRRFSRPGDRSLILGTSVFCALVFLQANHRIDPQHLLQVLPPALVLLAWYARVARSGLPGGWGHATAALLFVLPVFLLGDQRERYDRPTPIAELGPKWAAYGSTRAELRAGKKWDRETARWVERNVAPGEDMLVIPYRPQMYWLAERGYRAPFGWFIPRLFEGRFTIEDFLAGLAGTTVVVDEVGFAFDFDPTRNARSYAPELMRALYETRAIVRAQGPVLFLSDDPELISSSRFFHSFRPSPEPYEEGTRRIAEVDTGNTLDWSPAQPLKTVQGGGLLVEGTAESKPGGKLWILLRGEQSFRAPAELAPLTPEGYPFQCLADTKGVPVGRYAVEIAIGSPKHGHRLSTALSVEVVELP